MQWPTGHRVSSSRGPLLVPVLATSHSRSRKSRPECSSRSLPHHLCSVSLSPRCSAHHGWPLPSSAAATLLSSTHPATTAPPPQPAPPPSPRSRAPPRRAKPGWELEAAAGCHGRAIAVCSRPSLSWFSLTNACSLVQFSFGERENST